MSWLVPCWVTLLPWVAERLLVAAFDLQSVASCPHLSGLPPLQVGAVRSRPLRSCRPSRSLAQSRSKRRAHQSEARPSSGQERLPFWCPARPRSAEVPTVGKFRSAIYFWCSILANACRWCALCCLLGQAASTWRATVSWSKGVTEFGNLHSQTCSVEP